MYRQRQNILLILTLLSITIITRLALIIRAPYVYNIDSYAYMVKGIDFGSSGAIEMEIGTPFVFVLGGFFKIFGCVPGVDPILISRFCMLLFSSVLVLVTYFFGLKMSGKIFGFSAAVLAIFEPYFLSYSIVPHIDVFAITMCLLALYFASADNKSRYILALIFFYLAVGSKAEFYLPLIIPILVFHFYNTPKIRSKRGITMTILVIFVYVVPAIWVYPRTTLGRFSIIERFTTFLTPNLLKVTLDSLFSFYNQPLLNLAFLGLVIAGLVLALLSIFIPFISFSGRGNRFLIKYKSNIRIRDILKSDKVMVALCLFLFCVVYILILTAYGFGYTVNNGIVTITPSLPVRYLILPRVLMSYPLAYPLSLTTKKFVELYVHYTR